MLFTWQARVFVSTVLMVGIVACSGSKQSGGGEETGTTQAAEKGAGDAQGQDKGSPSGGSTSTDKPAGTPAPAPINIPELIGKMTWNSEFYNNSNGKVFTGYDGTNPFKVLVDVTVYGELPETVKLTEEQADQLYNSPEYQAAAKAQTAKISFTADAAFVTTKMVDEYPEGRVYELTTVKAGSTAAKAKWDTKELPLTIQIAAYTAAQVAAGKTRYNTAVAGATPSPACATCHRSATGVDHSPYFMSQYTDAALQSTIETGVNSDDGYTTKTAHKMTFSGAADKAGIVPYLRSLDPNLLPDQQAK